MGHKQRAACSIKNSKYEGCEKAREKKLHWNTTFGIISITEQLFWHKGKKVILRPFTLLAKVSCRARSFLLQRALVDFGADESFASAAKKIKEHYGVEVASSTTRIDVEKHAQAIHERIGKKILCVMPAAEATAIVGEIDGSMIPVVRPKEDECCCNDRRKNKEHEWKEARLAIARSKGSVEHICAVTLGSTDDAGKKLAEVIKSAGEGEKTKIHCVGDGAFWIAEQIEQLFGAKATFLLDFYHVSEYLAKASICCEPEMSFAWMRTQQSLLKCNGVDNVLKNMQEHIQVCPLKEDCAALKCFNYLEKRLNQLDYKSAIESDLPIGSGEVESAHRSIVQARLKIPGAWWDIQNAQNMLDLRTTRSNGLWDQYWNNIRPISEVCANG